MKRYEKIRRQYLIWLDILGFEELAKEIAERSGVSERKVRDDFVHLLNEKIDEAVRRGEIVGKKYGESEDWILVTDSLDLAFKVVASVLHHNTEYRGYEKIPLEIGIGVGQYDNWARLDGSRLVIENATIEFLKSHVIDCYREWYARTNLRRTKSTFVVLTESAYEEMDPLDQEICRKVEYCNSKREETRTTFFVAETERIKDRGMVLEFLEKIERLGSLWYSKIDRTFVPPDEYEDMVENLEKHNIVILVGDPEIGKTFTAARMMWEYYCRGYKPIWHSGSELIERMKARQMMSEAQISEHSVTYFEDPFGKTKFEDREELRREIGSFLARAQSLDCKIIITSREELFKVFQKEKLSQSDLRKFVKEMKLTKPSYTNDKQRVILLNWAKAFGCKWLRNEELRTFVLEKAMGRLHTPLALKDFAYSSKDCTARKTISILIECKSGETKEAFAEEIINMGKEKILFLSLIHILPIPAKDIERIYHKMCEKLELDNRANSFDDMLIWFKDKIVSRFRADAFEFTHPSYEEGLIRCWNRNEARTLVLHTIGHLVEEDDPAVRGMVGYALIRDFEDISFKEKVVSLIETVCEDPNSITRYGVALGIYDFFGALPSSLALACLGEISTDRNREIRARALEIVQHHFGNIPREYALKLISNGLEDRAAYVRLATVFCVRNNLDHLPEDIVKRAFEQCGKLRDYSGYFVSYLANIEYSILQRDLKRIHSSEL